MTIEAFKHVRAGRSYHRFDHLASGSSRTAAQAYGLEPSSTETVR